MANFEERLSSFVGKRWAFKGGQCSSDNMAKAGFVCTAKNSVQCYYCEKELDGWTDTDDPWEEHCAHAPDCPFVMRYERAPDPERVTLPEKLELERQRQLLKVSRKYEETKIQIDKVFDSALMNITQGATKPRLTRKEL